MSHVNEFIDDSIIETTNISEYINDFIPDFEKIIDGIINQNNYLIDIIYYWSQYDFYYKILTYGILFLILILSIIVIFRIRLIK